MKLQTDGTQTGSGGWQIGLHDASNCGNKRVDLSSTSDRKVEIRVKSSVDVPQLLMAVVDLNLNIHSFSSSFPADAHGDRD